MKRLRAWLLPAAVLAAAAAAQFRALRAPFFGDDWLFLEQVRARSLFSALAAPDPIGNFFRPLGRAAWFWALGQLGGESPLVFHVANLVLWLVAVALLWAIARAAAGPRVAAIAAALFALTHAADVPVLWACGAQDLLALALALGAVLAFQRGRAWPAAALLLLAPLAKETAVVAIVPAVLLARVNGERWSASVKRAWPLWLALAAWGVLAAYVLVRRHAPASALAWSPWGPLAALAGLLRVAFGLEWRTGGALYQPFLLPRPAEMLALALAMAGVALTPGVLRAHSSGARERARPRAGARREPRPAAASRSPGELAARGPLSAALAWAVCAALPVALVSQLWSAYYFLFAMAGAALALGIVFARIPTPAALAAVLALGLASRQAGSLDEFATAPSPWSAQSHVNLFYLYRGMTVVSRCIADLRGAHPRLPARSTVFFAGVPAFAALQVGDGPLVRGVYRDTSLKSYYVTAVTGERIKRGPVFVMMWDQGKSALVDRTDEPRLWFNLGISCLMSEHPEAAAQAFEFERARSPQTGGLDYLIALVVAGQGDTLAAQARLAAQGFGLARSAGEAMGDVEAHLAIGDTLGATAIAERARQRAMLDPEVHRMLSVLFMSNRQSTADGVFEAYAAIALIPGDALAWRNWGALQRRSAHDQFAYNSLQRYFALDPTAEARDDIARSWRDQLRERIPGGRLAQQGLKQDLNMR